MNSYFIRTNLLVSVFAAFITVALQVIVFETTYAVPSIPIEQLPGITAQEKLLFFKENTVAVTGFENAKGYFSSSEALLSILKRRVLPIFIAVLVSLFAVDYWHCRRKNKQAGHM